MKKTISFLLSLVLLFSVLSPVFADDTMPPADDPIIPELSISGSLSFSGTTASCYGSVTELGKSIVATMTLYHNGTSVGSWSNSGTSNVILTGSCHVEHGQTYTLIISGSVDGVAFSSTPYTRTCP